MCGGYRAVRPGHVTYFRVIAATESYVTPRPRLGHGVAPLRLPRAVRAGNPPPPARPPRRDGPHPPPQLAGVPPRRPPAPGAGVRRRLPAACLRGGQASRANGHDCGGRPGQGPVGSTSTCAAGRGRLLALALRRRQPARRRRVESPILTTDPETHYFILYRRFRLRGGSARATSWRRFKSRRWRPMH